MVINTHLSPITTAQNSVKSSNGINNVWVTLKLSADFYLQKHLIDILIALLRATLQPWFLVLLQWYINKYFSLRMRIEVLKMLFWKGRLKATLTIFHCSTHLCMQVMCCCRCVQPHLPFSLHLEKIFITLKKSNQMHRHQCYLTDTHQVSHFSS